MTLFHVCSLTCAFEFHSLKGKLAKLATCKDSVFKWVSNKYVSMILTLKTNFNLGCTNAKQDHQTSYKIGQNLTYTFWYMQE